MEAGDRLGMSLGKGSFTLCDCDSSYGNKWVVQESSVPPPCECNNITNSYTAHYEQNQIAVANRTGRTGLKVSQRKGSLCTLVATRSKFNYLPLSYIIGSIADSISDVFNKLYHHRPVVPGDTVGGIQQDGDISWTHAMTARGHWS